MVDVTERTSNGALQHVAVKTSGMVTTNHGGLYGISDVVHHGVHGR